MTAERRGPGTTLRQRTADAVARPGLRVALAQATDRFASGRVRALAELDDADALRSAARAARADVLARLPDLLEQLADNLVANGVHVHWADDGDDANRYVADVARRHRARRVAKSKSMASEETGLNRALQAAGCDVTETDLGEWVIQLAEETPSHIIVPAVHRDRHRIAEVLRALPGAEKLGDTPEELVSFARARLRDAFLDADMGVSGVNFAVAETGTLVLVTNEGNLDLVASLPRVHVAILGMERVVADLDQLDLLLALLARSATGQPFTSYTSLFTGPRRAADVDGPDELHVVILDNGRSEILASELHEMLACIRCGACLNVCPVYRQVGGHAYGWVYSGPMGAVLTPLLERADSEAAEVADASTLCAACMDACPVGIPLQDLLLGLRRQRAQRAGRAERLAWRSWSRLWSTRRGFEATAALGRTSRLVGDALSRAPVARDWSFGRTLPRPAAVSFRQLWARGEV